MAPKSSTASKKSSTGSKSAETDPAAPATKTKAPKVPTEYILRPSFADKSVKNIAKIYVSPRLVTLQGWNVGAFVKVSKGLNEIIGMLSVWDEKDEDKYDLNVVLISTIFLKHLNLLLGDRISITKISTQPKYCDSISIEAIKTQENEISEDEIKSNLDDQGILYNKMFINERFNILDISNSLEDQLEKLNIQEGTGNDTENGDEFDKTPFLFNIKTTKITITYKDTIGKYEPIFSFNKIGGLDHKIEKINSTISIPLKHPGVFTKFGIEPPRGLLLHGPSGTGKSLLMKTLAHESLGTHIISVNGPSIVSKYLGGTEEKLRDYFQEAIKYQPSIIFMDEIDSLVPSRNTDDSTEVDGRVVATLLTMLDSLTGSVVVIGATNRINSIDSSLRRPGRFDQELEIGIPEVDARFDILNKQFQLMNGNHSLKTEDIREISNKTHGYVGADLVSLCRESISLCIRRGLKEQNLQTISNEFDSTELFVSLQDVEDAMKEIRPSAMREILLEMPKVKWSDIGGQEVLKRKLKEMVQLPLTAQDTFKRLGISAPKGLLLYGPPGCSKTLTAKALASESGLNFLAVKGPEIFNKYVGESERAIREIFRKARSAAPSIIFFDEIDAIASSRDGGEDSSHASKQVLNSMLNEIDGVEELKGVVIIGATNRPDIIDPALLRPGRLDRHVYVSPPDDNARLQILQKNTVNFKLADAANLLDKLVEWTEGFSGSEVVLLCQEAGLTAIMDDNDCDSVKEEHFERAIRDISKNITQEMLDYYADFADKYQAAA